MAFNVRPKNKQLKEFQYEGKERRCDLCWDIEDSILSFKINGKIHCFECYPLKNQLEAFAKKYYLSKRGMSNNQQQLIKRQYDRL